MVLNEMTEHCTNLVRDVLAVWFLRMDLDGSLAEQVRRALLPTETCPAATESAETDTSALSVEDMLGIFSVHAALVLLAVLLRFCYHAKERTPSMSKSMSKVMSTRSMFSERSAGSVPAPALEAPEAAEAGVSAEPREVPPPEVEVLPEKPEVAEQGIANRETSRVSYELADGQGTLKQI